MTHILINGACGHMGRVIADVIANREDCTVLAGVDPDSAQMVAALRAVFPTALQAVSFLTFVLLYMPCVAAYAAMRREMESGRLATLAVAGQTLLAWCAATLVFQAGRLLGLG